MKICTRVGLTGAAAALALAGAAAISAAPAVADTLPTSQTFGYNGTYQYLTVPKGVHEVHLTAWGGSGGAGGANNGLYAAPGGMGALINLDAPVSPGDQLVIEVGAKGGDASGGIAAGAGGYASGTGNEGGPGGNVNGNTAGTAGGGGGGATTVIDPSASSTPLLIAAGGGGGGGGGENAGYNGGQGGDGGTSVNGSCDPTYGPGEYGNGTTGGAGGSCGDPQAGPGGISGEGEAPLSNAGTGGGGGGGLAGGDGGADGGGEGGGAGGGGAGSSFWSPVAANAVVANGGPGNGGVTVSWYVTPPAGITKTLTYAGAPQEFTVPAGVDQLTITGSGGSGGFGGGNATGFIASRGGLGATITELVAVNPGELLMVGPGEAGGNGELPYNPQPALIPGGPGGLGGGSVIAGAAGGPGGSVTVPDSGSYIGGTGGGGGGATFVLDVTSLSTLLEAGGGGGGGGDKADGAYGENGGPGGNAGSPLVSGNDGDGAGLDGSGYSGLDGGFGGGGAYAAAGGSAGQPGADSSRGLTSGTGGGGGGGALGGGDGLVCTGGLPGAPCQASGGGGGAGSSAWASTAQQVRFANSLGGGGAVTISWVQPSTQAVTFTSTPPAHPVHGGSYTPAATGGASGNPVVFSIDPASSAGACVLAGGTVSFTGVGSCVVDANQAGGNGYQAAPQVQQAMQIAKASQTITFTSAPPGQPVHGGSYTLAARGGGSGNPVVFSIDSLSARVCSLNSAGTTVSFTGAGPCLIHANQAGNADYDPAAQKHQSFLVVYPPSAQISSPASGQTFRLGEHVATSFACVEGADGPGLSSCADSGGTQAPSGVLDTSTAGTFTYTVIATSKDGLTGRASIKYTVRPGRR